MDLPVLHPLVERLRAGERLPAFAAALPARARVAEPALPLLLAALYEELGGFSVLLPEDTDARDTAEAIGWFLGEDRVALLPSRGVSLASGLEPAPHLVGERARALAVLDRGGIVCASALAVAELVPPPGARAQPIELEFGGDPGIDGLAASLVAAGYERVDRVEERGQLAVRGGLIDVFPTTGREPLRVEFFGDEIESIRAFSPFTQRALRQVESATIYPAAERLVTSGDDDAIQPARRRGGGALRELPDDLVPPLAGKPDFVWQPDDVRAVWHDEGCAEISFEGTTELDPFPQGPAVLVRGAAARARRARDLGGGERALRPAPPGPRHRRRVRPPR